MAIRGILISVEAAMINNIKNFFFASSSEVYQTPKIIPTPEEAELVIPDVFNKRYSYGGGKLISELVCLNYYRDFFEKMIIFRPHNVYGTDMGDEHVIPQLIYKSYQAYQEDKGFLEIKGDGKQTRTFIHINDFTDCLIQLLNHGEHRNIYHIGNMDEISIEHLLELIHSILNLKLTIKKSTNPQGETLRRCPNNNKIKLLGYNQKMKIKDGLNDVVPWYIKHYFNKDLK